MNPTDSVAEVTFSRHLRIQQTKTEKPASPKSLPPERFPAFIRLRLCLSRIEPLPGPWSVTRCLSAAFSSAAPVTWLNVSLLHAFSRRLGRPILLLLFLSIWRQKVLQQSDDAPTVQPRLERSLHQLEQALSTQPEIGSRRSGAVAVAAVDFSSPRLKDGLGPMDYAVLPSSSALVALFVLALDGDRRRQRGDVRRGIFPSGAAL
ncbi:hypothetical protein MTO96_044550 [Rhipicephalus appendiculatus]